MSRLARLLKTLALLAMLPVAVYAGYWASQFAPPRFLPWAPLDIADLPVYPITAMKLERLQWDRRYCEAALATASLRVTPVAEIESKGCDLHDVIRVESGYPAFNASFIATCPLSVGMAMFIRDVVQPAASRDLHSDVVEIDHLGSFACRNIVGGHSGRLSEHAAANAIDVAGFVLRDGQRVTVERDWRGGDDKAKFLHDVRDGSCGIFHVVLSPDFNAAHRTHLHLDMGAYRMCR
jgi:hypothetical protein